MHRKKFQNYLGWRGVFWGVFLAISRKLLFIEKYYFLPIMTFFYPFNGILATQRGPITMSVFSFVHAKSCFRHLFNVPKVFVDVEGVGWENPEIVHGFGTFSGGWFPGSVTLEKNKKD